MAGHGADQWAGEHGKRWDAHLDVYETMMAPAGDALMAFAGFQPGQSAVDIGCGGGATTLSIARSVGPDGRALGVDISQTLIAGALARRDAAGIANAGFQVLDAETGTPESPQLDHGFDRAFSRFGVMFFGDTARAFANIRQWLKPGGQLVFACWAPPSENPWMARITETMGAFLDLPPPDPQTPLAQEPGPFRLSNPDTTRAMLQAAGHADITIEKWRGEQPVGGAGASPQDAARFVLEGMTLGKTLAEQAPQHLNPARAALETLFAGYHRDGAVHMPAATWMMRARRP